MAEIARLKIKLTEQSIPVSRRIEVRLDTRLDDLHVVLQVAMGWENCHLYEFQVGPSIRYGVPDPAWEDAGLRSAKNATLADLIDKTGRNNTFDYLYDFGDYWLHTVRLEAAVDAAPDVTYPRLLEAHGRCPPEDCGGPGGYVHYLEAISDPNHEDHAEMVEWGGPGFDPGIVDEDAIRNAFAALVASKRRRRKRGTRQIPKIRG